MSEPGDAPQGEADDPDGHFGESVAARYDETSEPMFDPALVGPVVDRLAELAEGGRALEFGIGTGRIALPLAARGVAVHGIDLSKAMVARLREKPGGEGIETTIGDYTTATVDGTFRLVYVVWNTIMNVTSQAGQVAAFRNAARHLEPGGRFVVEVGVPALRRLPPGDRYVVFDAGDTHWGVDEYDVAKQGLVSHHFQLVDGRFEGSSGPFRYVWPAELDLMAQLAGMELRDRWAGWQAEPFTSESTGHVSVWQKVGSG
jgi:SAM-dependent methyltransferase